MPERDLQGLLDSPRYKDRGGFKVFSQIYNGALNYEQKIDLIHDTFKVTNYTARTWYSRYKNMGVK